MPSLLETQREIAQYIASPRSGPLAMPRVDEIVVQSPRARIYRNSVRDTLREAMAATFPVVLRLVGEPYFDALVARYLIACPSRSGNILELGRDLPSFVDGLPELESLPYLADVARLEWLIRDASRAADAPLSDLATILAVPPERYGEIEFSLHPSVRLLCSTFPVLQIWQANQPQVVEPPTIALDDGGELLLIARREIDVEIARLGRGEFTLLVEIGQGRGIDAAIESAVANESGIDVGALLSRHLASRTVVVSTEIALPDECDRGHPMMPRFST
jgi:hypothetical protein